MSTKKHTTASEPTPKTDRRALVFEDVYVQASRASSEFEYSAELENLAQSAYRLFKLLEDPEFTVRPMHQIWLDAARIKLSVRPMRERLRTLRALFAAVEQASALLEGSGLTIEIRQPNEVSDAAK